MLERLVEAPPATATVADSSSFSTCKKASAFMIGGRNKTVLTRSEGSCNKERKLLQYKARKAGPGVKCEWRKGRVECASALPMALSGLIIALMGWVRKAGLVMGGLLSTFLMVLVDLVGALVALITMRGRRVNLEWHKRQESMSGIEEWVDVAALKRERLEGELAALEERLGRLYTYWEDVKRPSSLEFNLYQLHILEISARTVGVLEEMVGYEMSAGVESQVYSWAACYDHDPISIWEALVGDEVGSEYAEARKETKKILEREVGAERALPQPWDDTTIV
jgi:hypothetical protein